MSDENSEIINSVLNRTNKDKFLLIFSLPEALRNANKKYVKTLNDAGVNTKSIKLLIKSANIPEIKIRSLSIGYGGANVYVSSHTRDPYEPLNVKFTISNNYSNYTLIYEWINFIMSELEGHYDTYDLTRDEGLNAYSTNMSLVALDEFNNIKMQWIYTYAFPVSLSGIEYDYESHDNIEASVSFMYSSVIVENKKLQGKDNDGENNNVF